MGKMSNKEAYLTVKYLTEKCKNLKVNLHNGKTGIGKY